MRIIESGVLRRSEPGTARAILSFPCAVALSNGQVLATYRTGSEKDGDDEVIEMVISSDNGMTWSEPRIPFEVPRIGGHRGTIKVCYLTEVEPDHLLAAGLWVDREAYPGQPIFNPDTEGCLPMAVILSDSSDGGTTWSSWRNVPMPEDLGPPSLTNPVLRLPDGTLAMSIETNKTYDDTTKWHQRVVLRHSTDQGKTWGEPHIAGFDPSGRIFNWDQRAGVAPDGRIGTFVWTFDRKTETYLNIHRRISSDGGITWSAAEDLGVTDQASRPAVLSDGQVVLAWVDRFNTQTIRARLASSIDATFDAADEVVLYTHQNPLDGDVDRAGAMGFSVWSFGLPFAETLSDGNVVVLYYAGTETAMDIHRVILDVDR